MPLPCRSRGTVGSPSTHRTSTECYDLATFAQHSRWLPNIASLISWVLLDKLTVWCLLGVVACIDAHDAVFMSAYTLSTSSVYSGVLFTVDMIIPRHTETAESAQRARWSPEYGPNH
ncbi:hypothetical protein EXIGLDRAFT_90113 [Exidia glandulosa HHB12029]|uniref:Uncharacterized protein n=1 Tax=Exidia glandulosa HHB12029 TaxID=1314781 RepID=A0A165NVZ7_EXIGL|nr:hypothetical protein EXIGLDRAFT_90113 [Exidia glandulosa HHB12029]